jgi:glycosyltransferase involved in cell wall biosynthesis
VGKDLRVCVVSPLYHPSLGGLGRQAQLLTEKLAENGMQMLVIARRMKGMPPAVFNPKVKILRAWSMRPYTYTFEKVKLTNILISLTFSLSCAFLLIRERNKYDIVHFQGASLPLFLNLPLLTFLRKKVLAKVASANLGIEAGSLRGRYLGLGNFISKLLLLVDAFIATTEEIENGLRRDGFSGEKIKRIPNFIDFSVFGTATADQKKHLKNKLGLGKDPCVVFSGRFIQRKGINFLLEAWKKVVGNVATARLILLGDGPLLGEMKTLTRELGIGDSVDFRGHVHEVPDFLRAADIFILPSLQEGMPNALLEAMACGMAPVGTRIGGVVDLIQEGVNGILAEPGDSDGLAEGMLKLLRDKHLADAIALRSYETIRDHYHLDSIVPRYRDLYQKLSDRWQTNTKVSK